MSSLHLEFTPRFALNLLAAKMSDGEALCFFLSTSVCKRIISSVGLLMSIFDYDLIAFLRVMALTYPKRANTASEPAFMLFIIIKYEEY